MLQLLNKKKEIEAEAIRNIPLEQCHFEGIVGVLYRRVHRRKGKVVISGMGKAGQVGQSLATTLCSTGTPAVFLHPSEAQHGDLGIIQESDVLILVSNSGKTDEVLALLQQAHRRFFIPAFAIVGNANSPLANKVEGILTTGRTEEICPLGLTPTTSTTCMSVLCDLLVIAMMDKINFSREEYALSHHSGYLGTKARED